MDTRYYFISYTFSKAKTSGVGSVTISADGKRSSTEQVCKYIADKNNYHNVVINNFIQITKEQFEDGIF